MALAPNPKLENAVTALVHVFSPVYQAWRPTQTGILPASARECLYADILALGCFLSRADKINQALEAKLLAEALVMIKMENTSMPYEYLIETVDKEIILANAATVQNSSFPELMMIKAANEWATGQPMRKATVKDIANRLADLVNYFVMYDGNISREELTVFAELEKKFAAA